MALYARNSQISKVSQSLFFHLRAMEAQLFANIWKDVLASFAPSNCAPKSSP